MDLHAKYQALLDYLRSYGRVAVAFSGGIDSAFLLHAAHEALGDDTCALTCACEFAPQSERDGAARFCEEHGIMQIEVPIEMLADGRIARNDEMRCYHCKKLMFETFIEIARDASIEIVVDGSNLDDEPSRRPGMRAIAELGIKSPLRELKFTKEDIRRSAQMHGLDIWDKPSFSCLATKVPAGTVLTAELLSQ